MDRTQIFNNVSHGGWNCGMRLLTTAYSGPSKSDLGDLTNSLPFFAYLQDCNPGWFDYKYGEEPHTSQNYCLCEELTNMNDGAFAAICNARTGPCQQFHSQFWDAVIREGTYAIGDAHVDSREEYISQIHLYRGIYFWQHLFGDPAVKIKMNRIPFILDGSDFNGDGTSDISIFRSKSGLWAIRNITRVYFGTKTDLPANGDYTGDGTTEIAIFRKTNGLWAIRNLTRCYHGDATSMPVPGDYNGDGTTDIAVYLPSESMWSIRNFTRIYYGDHMDITTILDYDGDGTDDIAVFRPSTGQWWIRGMDKISFGREEDLPVPADYNGNGTDEIAIFRPSNNLWAIRGLTRSYFGDFETYYGLPVPGDYNGNGTSDICVFRGLTGLWAVKNVTRCYFGKYSDYPITSKP